MITSIITTTTLQECERHITLLHDHRLDDVELGGNLDDNKEIILNHNQ